MRFSPKEVLIRKHVKTKMIWRGKFCSACNYQIWFEMMYKVGDELYCYECCKSKEEAFDLVFPAQVSTKSIVARLEKKKANQILQTLINDLNNLPDGEVSPSVLNKILCCQLE